MTKIHIRTSSSNATENTIREFSEVHFDDLMEWPYVAMMPPKLYGKKAFSITLKTEPQTYIEKLRLITNLLDCPIDDLEIVLPGSHIKTAKKGSNYFRTLT